MLKNLCTRRFLGFLVAMVVVLIDPTLASWVSGMYTALIGAAIVDSIKGK